ncbi:MAG: DDE-type integrase/transposase/recombinase [Thermoleophilaceae bacterium]
MARTRPPCPEEFKREAIELGRLTGKSIRQAAKDLGVSEVSLRNWVTYLRSWEGWLYLAAVQDAYSRAIVGWSMAEHMRAELVVDALGMGLARRRPDPGLVARLWPTLPPGRHRHLDGSEGLRARQRGLRVVLRLAQEGTHPPALLARGSEPRSAIFEWIEAWYNPRRLHSTLGYLSPQQLQQLLLDQGEMEEEAD